VNRRQLFTGLPVAAAGVAAGVVAVKEAVAAPPAERIPNTIPDFLVHQVIELPEPVTHMLEFHGQLIVCTERSVYAIEEGYSHLDMHLRRLHESG
jgi:hypothetical protein